MCLVENSVFTIGFEISITIWNPCSGISTPSLSSQRKYSLQFALLRREEHVSCPSCRLLDCQLTQSDDFATAPISNSKTAIAWSQLRLSQRCTCHLSLKHSLLTFLRLSMKK